jgi:hypothetical protein
MALWKPFRGSRASLDTLPLHSGYVYFCTDDGSLFFDYPDAEGNVYRKQINAKQAESLLGYSIATALNSVDTELPTSKAVSDAIEANKISVSSGNKYIGVEQTGNDYAVSVDETELAGLIAQNTAAAMEFKGVTATLPEHNPEAGVFVTKGDLYKVTAEIVVAAAQDAQGVGFTAKHGDSIVCDGTKWYLIPSGDDVEDTWRAIKVNGEQALGNDIDTYALNLVAGTNVTITNSEEGNIVFQAIDTTYAADDVTLALNENTFEVKDGGINTAQLADRAVTGNKIAVETITEGNLDPNIQLSLGRANSAVQDIEITNGDDNGQIKYRLNQQGDYTNIYVTGLGTLAFRSKLGRIEEESGTYATYVEASEDGDLKLAGETGIDIESASDINLTTASNSVNITASALTLNGVNVATKNDIPTGTGNVVTAHTEGNTVVLTGGVKLDDHQLVKDRDESDIRLADVAATGNVNDLVQTTGDYLIFDCGTSTTVV